MKFLVINGVNLNLLGVREPEKYGTLTLKDLEKSLYAYSFELGVDLEMFQSNFEGEIVEKIHSSRGNIDGIVINAGAYTHTSVAIRDALAGVDIPTIEVHLTNIYKREEFRHHSYIAPVAAGQISGLGFDGYKFAIPALKNLIEEKN